MATKGQILINPITGDIFEFIETLSGTSAHRHIDSKAFLASIPIELQKMLMSILEPIGRILGYRAIYKKYASIEK